MGEDESEEENPEDKWTGGVSVGLAQKVHAAYIRVEYCFAKTNAGQIRLRMFVARKVREF